MGDRRHDSGCLTLLHGAGHDRIDPGDRRFIDAIVVRNVGQRMTLHGCVAESPAGPFGSEGLQSCVVAGAATRALARTASKMGSTDPACKMSEPVEQPDQSIPALHLDLHPALDPARRGTIVQVTTSPASAQHLSDLAWLRRVRDRIDREYAQPLDVEALARGANMSAGHLSRQFRLAYGEPPYAYLMTRRIERAMALLRRGDLSVTDVCFAVGCSSLSTFSSRFTELVGVPPSVYRRQAARSTAGIPSCVARQVTRPIRNREAPAPQST